jgi:uncharacterized LabA/DUF88 family protein
MIYRNPQQRVAVLVDVQNLYYSAKNIYNAHVSYKSLLALTVGSRILTRAIAYVIRTPQRVEESFFEAINTSGFEVKEKNLQVFADGAMKGDWDLGIAMDAIRLGHKVDSIILCSGDGDYVPVVNYLQQALGCLVEVAAFKQTANKELTEICDDFIDLDENKEQVLFRPKPYKKRRTS